VTVDATSGAVRLARAYTRRDRIAVCGYHGWQDWYIGSTARHRGVPDAVRTLSPVSARPGSKRTPERAERRRRGVVIGLAAFMAGVLAVYIMCLSCLARSSKMSTEISTTGSDVVFCHQCDVPLPSGETSPALCTIGTAQLLAYSMIEPLTT